MFPKEGRCSVLELGVSESLNFFTQTASDQTGTYVRLIEPPPDDSRPSLSARIPSLPHFALWVSAARPFPPPPWPVAPTAPPSLPPGPRTQSASPPDRRQSGSPSRACAECRPTAASPVDLRARPTQSPARILLLVSPRLQAPAPQSLPSNQPISHAPSTTPRIPPALPPSSEGHQP